MITYHNGGQVHPIVILRHPNCQESRCPICLEDHLSLGYLLNDLCKTGNSIDHLGKIHSWMSDNGKSPETEWGWATPETFSPVNVREYVEWFTR